MTEVQLFNQLCSVFDVLITGTENLILVQKNKKELRVNTGSSIMNLPSGIFNFSSTYSLMSLTQVAQARKMIDEIRVQMSLYVPCIIPKRWGYKVKLYDGVKCKRTYKIRLQVTNSPIVCYFILFRRLFSKLK